MKAVNQSTLLTSSTHLIKKMTARALKTARSGDIGTDLPPRSLAWRKPPRRTFSGMARIVRLLHMNLIIVADTLVASKIGSVPIRILLVEDDTLIRKNVAMYLRRLQFDVEEAATGDQALRLIKAIDNYDVVITDLRMPGMTNGLDVLALQQQISPGTAGVLTTAFGNDDVEEQAHSLDAVLFRKTNFPSRIGFDHQ
jgi:CheY-like chemotaxis protein